MSRSFDVARRRCQSFQYTGCGPSANVFSEEGVCEAKCDRYSKVEVRGKPFYPPHLVEKKNFAEGDGTEAEACCPQCKRIFKNKFSTTKGT